MRRRSRRARLKCDHVHSTAEAAGGLGHLEFGPNPTTRDVRGSPDAFAPSLSFSIHERHVDECAIERTGCGGYALLRINSRLRDSGTGPSRLGLGSRHLAIEEREAVVTFDVRI